MRPLLRLAMLTVPLLAASARAGAQHTTLVRNSTGEKRSGWLTGASIGVPAYEGDAVTEMLTIGVHWTQLRPGRLGADFSLGTMPRALAEGVVVVGARGGVALPLALSSGVLVLPSAGVSFVGGVGAGGGGATAGLNAGIAAVLFGASSVGLRTGVTWHRFGNSESAVALWEIGFVRAPRPR
jgi:hypothetical protein